MKKVLFIFCIILILSGCFAQQEKQEMALINPEGKIIEERIDLPSGYERIIIDPESFGHFLRTLPLKPYGAKVKYYNGEVKTKDVYEAVVDLDTTTRDLQQCADAVIRLRAEYLYKQKRFDEIHFNFTNGFNAEYSKWIEGYRISVNGNKTNWVKTSRYSTGYSEFRKYLDIVFAYAGTLSLSKELIPVKIEEMKVGDIFIQGGSPGHCVIVVDMAKNKRTKEKLFILAQSYMPAQDIHMLKNPLNKEISPWYSLDFKEELITPEWTFKKTDLKKFKE